MAAWRTCNFSCGNSHWVEFVRYFTACFWIFLCVVVCASCHCDSTQTPRVALNKVMKDSIKVKGMLLTAAEKRVVDGEPEVA
jgi:hypothetical protein